MFGTLPLMAIVVIIYNVVVYLTGLSMESQITSISLISGAVWTISVGDLIVYVGLLLLFLELVNICANAFNIDHMH